jgi:hypothetical protein
MHSSREVVQGMVVPSMAVSGNAPPFLGFGPPYLDKLSSVNEEGKGQVRLSVRGWL